ncbi:MAG: hypothetical protein COA45_12370 [Zetaproteobacteria bacterium]|nr:MAG: hypothetical protein COA45_12370 [Zetaproteobacteria bacterium]
MNWPVIYVLMLFPIIAPLAVWSNYKNAQKHEKPIQKFKKLSHDRYSSGIGLGIFFTLMFLFHVAYKTVLFFSPDKNIEKIPEGFFTVASTWGAAYPISFILYAIVLSRLYEIYPDKTEETARKYLSKELIKHMVFFTAFTLFFYFVISSK